MGLFSRQIQTAENPDPPAEVSASGAERLVFLREQLENLSQQQAHTAQLLEQMARQQTQAEEIFEKIEDLRKNVARIRKEQQSSLQRMERIERLLEQNGGLTEKKREQQVVVTFTSYGARIETVPLMLERIFNQTLKPDRVVMYLSRENFPGEEKDLPERVLSFRAMGLEIRWLSDDIRSYKKLLPALRDFPEEILITVDDDLFFDLDLVEQLMNTHRRFPRAIVGLRVHRMLFGEDGRPMPYEQWDKEYTDPERKPSMGLLATTGAGTLFPPHIFPEEVQNLEAIRELAPAADDIWVKIMSVISHVPVVPPEKKRKLVYIPGTQEDRLWTRNITDNDIQLAKLLDRYDNCRSGEMTLLEEMRSGRTADER